MSLTYIIPVYNEAEGLADFVEAFAALWDAPDTQVLFIDDGSRDATPDVLARLCAARPALGWLRLSRNFGKEQALAAGIDAVPDGRDVIVMDGDGQHTLAAVQAILAAAESHPEAQLVFGVRRDRAYQGAMSRGLSRAFYRAASFGRRLPMDDRLGDFFFARGEAVAALKRFTRRNLIWKGVYNYMGYERIIVPVDIAPRDSGQSKFSVFSRVSLAARSLVWISRVPLHLISLLGLLVSAIAFVTGAAFLIQYLIFGITLPGFLTLIVTQSLLGGMILLSLGIIAQYLAAVVDNTSDRPAYLVERTALPGEDRDGAGDGN